MTSFYDFIEMSQHLPLVYLAVGVAVTLWVFQHQDAWQAFLASLDTNGGHVIVLILLLVVGYRMFQSDATAGGQLMTGAEAALFILLNSKRPTRTGDALPEGAPPSAPAPAGDLPPAPPMQGVS